MKRFKGALRYLMVSSVVAFITVVSIIGLNVVGIHAQETRKPSAGLRLRLPVSAVVSEAYDQKVLNIYDAGMAHTLHYKCEWNEKNIEKNQYGSTETFEDKLPAGLELTDDGRIKGTPSKAGQIRIWVEVTWEGTSEKFSTIDKAKEDEFYNGYYESISFEIYDSDDSNSGHVEIDSNPGKIEVNKEFTLAVGEDKWFQFVSPSIIVGQRLTEYSVGVFAYDAKGYPMKIGPIDSSIPVSAGEMYYMHLKNSTEEDATLKITSWGEGTTIDETISGINNDLSIFGGNIELKQENVTKSFNGDDNTNWDIYEISETDSIDKGVLPYRYTWFWYSEAFVCPYKIHIDAESSANAVNPLVNTFSASTDTLAGGFSKVVCPDGCTMQGKTIVNYWVSDEDCYGTNTATFSVYIPHGKKIVDKGGVWCDSEIADEVTVPNAEVNKKCTITYDANGGAYTAGSTSSAILTYECSENNEITVGYDYPVVDAIPNPVNGDKKFLGYKIKGSTDGKLYNAGNKYIVLENVTFVAEWENVSEKKDDNSGASSGGKTSGIVDTNASNTPSTNTTSVVPSTSQAVTAPGKPSGLKTKNIKGKKVKVSFKKVKNAVGYQIQYAKNKKFKEAKKSVFTKKSSYTIKKLSKKKTYYVRVRAYKLSGKTKVYGKWSNIKEVKIKK